MTVDVRKSACMNRAAPPVLALCALLLAALWPSAAFPCGGPPATDCAAQLTCVLGSPEIHYLTTSSSAGTDIEVPARLHHSLFPPSSGAPCLNSQLIDVTVEANCEDLLVPGSGADWLFEGENELTDPAQGTQVLDVPLLIDIPAAEREDRGFCALTGTARLVQSDGTEFEVPCGPTSLSFARPNTGETKPILGAHFVDAGAPAEVGSGHYTTVAYTPAMLELLVENHHETECFSGTLQLVTNNENHKPELINGPIGENSNTNLSYTLSSGPGDDFIVQFAPPGDDEEVLLEAMCFDLPEPYLSISPTASREIALDAGESLSVEMWSRTWPNCADGSCSGMAMELSGTFCDGEPYQAFLGGSLIVKSVSFELAAPVGCPELSMAPSAPITMSILPSPLKSPAGPMSLISWPACSPSHQASASALVRSLDSGP